MTSAAVLAFSMLAAEPETPFEPGEPSIDIIDQTLEVEGQKYAWSIMIPPTAEEGGRSLLFLHGYGECGTDGDKQLTVGLPPAIEKNPNRWPFVVIVPQKPTHNSEWEEHEQAVLAMIEQATEMGFIDPQRLAITGLSQGGHGTIALAAAHPDMFTAAAPVCGYLRPFFNKDRERIEHPEATPETPAYKQAAEKLAKLPTWFWHGDSDSVVPVAESRILHQALKRIDAETKYTELPGVDHNSWDEAYSSSELSEWFKQHLLD